MEGLSGAVRSMAPGLQDGCGVEDFEVEGCISSLVKTFYYIHNAFKELGCSGVKL